MPSKLKPRWSKRQLFIYETDDEQKILE